MTAFVGLDLAWTPHHETGVCVLVSEPGGVRLHQLGATILAPEEFARLCESFGSDVIVAVDAPLVVETERRAEATLNGEYGKFHAGAYTATMAFLERMDGLAGPKLARELRRRGFELDPGRLAAAAPGRFALEVFPHPAHIEMFRIAHALKYKKGKVACRRAELARYQCYLGELLSRELPLVFAAPTVAEALGPEALQAKGRALKNLEDRLDALTCAYVAYHCWRYGQEGFATFGCSEHGCIVVPKAVPLG